MEYKFKHTAFLILALIILLDSYPAISQHTGQRLLVRQYLNISDSIYDFDLNKALKYADSAYYIATVLNDTNLLIETSLLLGRSYKSLSNIDSAKKYTYLAISLSDKTHDYENLIKSYIALGELNRSIYRSDTADIYITSAIALSYQKGITKYLPLAYNRMAAIYFEKFYNKYLTRDSSYFYKAIAYVDSSFFWSKLLNDSLYTINNYNILGACYTGLGNYEKSNFYLFEALKKAKQNKELIEIPYIYKNIASNYYEMHKYDFAITYAKKGAEIAEKLEMNEAAQFCYDFLTEIYIKRNDYKNAYKYHIKLDSLWEIIRKQNADKKFIEFKAEYETYQNKLLLEAQHEKIKMQRIFLVIVSIITIIVLILTLFLILQSKKIKRKNLDLERQNKKISELSNLQRSLQSMIVHDLKNPLSNIIAKSRDKSVLHSAKTMLNLVENILDVAKSEEATINLHKTTFTLNDILSGILVELEFAMNMKNISVEVPKNDFELYADKDLIKRVLVNLLNNAIRFAPENTTVIVAAEKKDDNNIYISVENKGKPIEESKLSTIFEKYAQLSVKNSPVYKSTGLGLTFCKMAIEAHGHKIWVKNIKDGVVFTFTVSGKENDKTITNTLYTKKYSFSFNKKETKAIGKYIIMLHGYKVHQISEIFDIINQVPDISQNVIEWKSLLKNAVYSSNQALFDELTSIKTHE